MTVDFGFNFFVWNLPAGVDFKVDLLTNSNLHKYVSGQRDGMLIMSENLVPPHIKQPQPENGMWVWEQPERWINPKGEVTKDPNSFFSRVFQPVGQ